MGRPTIIVQARMGSTRLPGKVLREVAGRPLLAYQLERLGRIPAVQLMVATTIEASDEPIVTLCESLAVPVCRGSEEDVLGRYAHCAASGHADPIVRVTSDCPLIDPSVVQTVLQRFQDGGCDYVANTVVRTFPRGLDTEVFSARALETANSQATDPYDREHVTPFFYRNPEQFRLCNVASLVDHSDQRWTVDTNEDFQLVSAVLGALYPVLPDFGMRDVLEFLADHPEVVELNQHVRQKSSPAVEESGLRP